MFACWPGKRQGRRRSGRLSQADSKPLACSARLRSRSKREGGHGGSSHPTCCSSCLASLPRYTLRWKIPRWPGIMRSLGTGMVPWQNRHYAQGAQACPACGASSTGSWGKLVVGSCLLVWRAVDCPERRLAMRPLARRLPVKLIAKPPYCTDVLADPL